MDAEGSQLMRELFRKLDRLIDTLVMFAAALVEEGNGDDDDDTYLDGTLK